MSRWNRTHCQLLNLPPGLVLQLEEGLLLAVALDKQSTDSIGQEEQHREEVSFLELLLPIQALSSPELLHLLSEDETVIEVRAGHSGPAHVS